MNTDLLSNLSKQFTDKIEEHVKKLDIPEPVKWIENNFFIPETRKDPKLNGKFRLQEYQKDTLREALSRDEKGNYRYSIIVWSDIKKSAKSTIAAAVNLYRAHWTDWGEFYVIANDLKQADSRVNYYLRRALTLNPKFNDKYARLGYRTTAPSGSFIEAIPIDPSGEAGSNADQITFCLDEQTEILTKDGWKGWETLSMDDLVATRSPDGCFEWQQPENIYCEEYSGKMIQISHRSLSALVTPDHRIYGKFIGGRGIASGVDKNWTHEFVEKLENRFLKASDAAKTTGYYPVVTSTWNGGSAESFVIPPTFGRRGRGSGTIFPVIQAEKVIAPGLFAEFMGWYLAEGCVIKKRGSIEGFAIGQSSTANPVKRERIINLLKNMGFVPHEWAGGMNIAVYHSRFGEYLSKFGLSDEKYIPEQIKNLPLPYLQIFLATFILGDGCKNKFGGIILSTRSIQLRDDLTEIAQKCGYSISSYENADLRWKKNPVMYSVYLRSPDSGRKVTKVEKKNWSEEVYSGIVFCPSTPNGVIYVRRKGTYYWTGNSELWGANEDAKQRMWSEMTLSPVKRGQSFRWIESYAGFQEESELLYSLYDLGVIRGELLWPDRLYEVTDGAPSPLEVYVNREAEMLCLWNTQPRCPWQTKEYYAAEEKILPPSDFLRMHRNQWVTSTETFVPMEWWRACQRTEEEWPKIDTKRHAMVVALDAAVSDDTFGLWMGCRHPTITGDVLQMFAQRWKPTQGHKVDFVGTEEKPGPELVLRRLIKDYNVVEVTYDPYQLHDMAMRFKHEGLTWFREFGQVQDRLKADSQFRDLIRDKRYWHRGEEDMTEHVQNANAKIDPEDRKIRIVKRMDKLKIDLCVAASMGSHEILRLNL